MYIGPVPLKASGNDFYKGQPVAVVGIHIGVDLKYKAGKLRFCGFHIPVFSMNRTGCRRQVHKAIQNILYPEIIQGTPEEKGRDLTCQVGLLIKIRIYTIDEFQFLVQHFSETSHIGAEGLITEIRVLFYFTHSLLAPFKGTEYLFVTVINSLEGRSHSHGPAQGMHPDFQFFFNLIQQFEGILGRPVHLIYKNHHRGLAHAAHLHESARLGLHPLGCIDNDNHAVCCREGTEGILGKVLVTGSIQDVNFLIHVIEAHDRSGHGDTPLLLYFHEIGSGCLPYLIGFHCPGNLYGSTK